MNLGDAFGLQVLRSALERTNGWKMRMGGEPADAPAAGPEEVLNVAY